MFTGLGGKTDAEREAERRQATEAADSARRDRDERRAQERTRALEVSRKAGVAITSAIQLMLEDVVDLATIEPAIRIVWLTPYSVADRVAGGAVSLGQHQTVLVPLIAHVHDYAVALHEIGHQRTVRRDGKLLRETDAWRWAMEHALVWDRAIHGKMVDCLRGYVAGAQYTALDMLGAAAVDAVIAEESYLRYAKPLADAVRAFEQRQFEEQHGRRTCQGTARCQAMASTTYQGWFMCARCADQTRVDDDFRTMKAEQEQRAARRREDDRMFQADLLEIRLLDEEIAELRAVRDRAGRT